MTELLIVGHERVRHRLDEAKEKLVSLEHKIAEDMEKEKAKLVALRQATPLAVKLGSWLQKKNIRALDLLRSWDPEGKGVLLKPSFREKMRTIVPDAEFDQIDELFDTLAGKGSAEVGLAKFRQGLKWLLEEAADAEAQTQGQARRAAHLEWQQAKSSETLELLREANKREAQIKAKQQQQPLMVRLGFSLVAPLVASQLT